MSHRPPREARPATAPFVLEVKRFEEGECRYVRCLSARYDGLAYHWIKGRGEWCNPKGCLPEWHKQKRHYKGYFAGEWWEERTKLWIPAAIEMTSAMELDFRRVYQRGQVWWIERLKPTKDSHPPMTGRLVEQLDPTTLPPPFDFMPVLCTVYSADVSLGVANWAPDRVIVSPSQGRPPGPVSAEEAANGPATNEQWQEFRQALKGAFAMNVEDTRNGRKN